MTHIDVHVTLDAKGLACPMPIVRAKKVMKDMEAGELLLVEATDRGSTADIRAWAESTGQQYLGTLEEGEILKHYLRKSAGEETAQRSFPHEVSTDQLLAKMESGEHIVIVDVREVTEYAFSHIPGVISIPLGELEERMQELGKEDDIYIICRSGTRSDFAAQKLAMHNFSKVFNVIPGMNGWKGSIEGLNE